MESKFTFLLVFAVFAQNSLAVNEIAFVNNLTVIQTAKTSTFGQFTVILDGFVDIVNLLANASCQNQDYDVSTINASIEAIKATQFVSTEVAYDDIRNGLRPIARNTAVLDANLEQAYAAFKSEIVLFHSVLEDITAKNYSEALIATEATEKVAIPSVGVLWTGIYDLIDNSIDTDNIELRNLLEHIERTAVTKAKIAWDTVFAEYKILLIQLSDKTQCQSAVCSFAIETQRNFALTQLRSEAFKKFTLFQYIATAYFIGEPQLIADYNKIFVAEEAIVGMVKSTLDSLLTILIAATENKDPSYNVTDVIGNELFPAFDAIYINLLTGVSYMQPQGSAIVKVNAASGYGYLDAVVGSFLSGIELMKDKNASDASAKMDAYEKTATVNLLKFYEHIYDEMKNITSTDDGVNVAISNTWNTTVSVAFRNAVKNMFAGLKAMAAAGDNVGTRTGCGAGVTAMNTVYNSVFYNVKEGIMVTFELIGASRLYKSFKANGIDVPFSAIYTPPV